MRIGIDISISQPLKAATVPAFTPTSISGLQLWLDASDASTLFTDSAGTTAATADGDPVGRWNDKSLNGNHVIQADGVKKPILKTAVQNSKNGVCTDGVNDYLKSSTGGNDTNYTLFVVNKYTNLGITHQMAFSMGEEAYGKRRCLWKNHFNAICFNGYSADVYFTHPDYAWSIPCISQIMLKTPATISGGRVRLTKNANSWSAETAPNNTMNAHTATSIYVGTNNQQTEAWSGNYYEILLYASLISDADRAIILDYLNAKWSVY